MDRLAKKHVGSSGLMEIEELLRMHAVNVVSEALVVLFCARAK